MTCCPNCSSATAYGCEVASVCAECISVSVAGASLPIGVLLIAAFVASVYVVLLKTPRHGRRESGHVSRLLVNG